MSVSLSILGGVGEIGMNMYVYETEKTAIIVDCGVMFADCSSPGIDYIMPDMTYIEDIKNKLMGVLLTHGHEDHIGAIPQFLKRFKVPIYGGRLTMGILGNKLNKKDSQYLHTVKTGETIERGDFKVRFVPVTHSIADTYALLVQTDDFKSLHCSDFKIDQTPVYGEPFNPTLFSEIGEEGLTLLLMDSTNAIYDGFTKSESSIKNDLIDIFHRAKGRIFFTSFSSNIDRFRQVFDIARQMGRKVVIEGASLDRNISIATKLGYLKLPEELVVTNWQALRMPDEEVCYIITGSQGEQHSTLFRVASQERKDLQVKDGDLFIISARVIPGNEKNLNALVNHIYNGGGKVVDIGEKNIHVSGHASGEELKLMLNLTRPKYLIPVHGEPVHLFSHMNLAESTGMIGEHIIPAIDGQKVTFKNGKMFEVTEVPQGKIYVDLRGDYHMDEEGLKVRKNLCRDGSVSVTILVKKGEKKPFEPATIKPVGFDFDNDLMFQTKKNISEDLGMLMDEAAGDQAKLEELISMLVRRTIRKRIDKRPVIVITIIELA